MEEVILVGLPFNLTYKFQILFCKFEGTPDSVTVSRGNVCFFCWELLKVVLGLELEWTAGNHISPVQISLAPTLY